MTIRGLSTDLCNVKRPQMNAQSFTLDRRWVLAAEKVFLHSNYLCHVTLAPIRDFHMVPATRVETKYDISYSGLHIANTFGWHLWPKCQTHVTKCSIQCSSTAYVMDAWSLRSECNIAPLIAATYSRLIITDII